MYVDNGILLLHVPPTGRRRNGDFLNVFDYVGSIVEIIINVAAQLIIGYVTNRKSQEESVFSLI